MFYGDEHETQVYETNERNVIQTNGTIILQAYRNNQNVQIFTQKSETYSSTLSCLLRDQNITRINLHICLEVKQLLFHTRIFSQKSEIYASTPP